MKPNGPMLWWNVASSAKKKRVAEDKRAWIERLLWGSTMSFVIVVILLLGGCAAKVEVLPQTTARPIAVTPPPVANGAIFQANNFRPLFEDRRARLVGDLLTIQIAEKTSASKSASTTADRSSSLSAGVTALPFLAPNSFNRANAAANSENNFEGKGTTANDNTFSGTIAVTVVEVLPNGNLVVAGEKQVGVNQNMDVLRFSGVVDPSTIRAGNVVNSTQIADARLAFRGKGGIDDAQTIGWLARFFLSVLPF